MPDHKIFNVGVVGYGLSAKIFHIPFIINTPQFHLHSIVQRSPKEGDSAPADFPKLKHFTSSKALIGDAEVDVVIITTTPDSHFELAKEALEAGKHVLVEKPFTPTSAEAEKLAAIASQNSRLICVYQNRRWDLDFLTVKQLIRLGRLGRIVDFNSHFDFYAPDISSSWKRKLDTSQGGTVLFDLGTHLIDQAYCLFGLPISVRGRLLNQREGKFDSTHPDAMVVELTYQDGLIVSLRANTLSVELPQPRFWVRGTKGSFHKHGLDPQEEYLVKGGLVSDERFGQDERSRFRMTIVADDGHIRDEQVSELQPETYKAFYAAWARAIMSGNPEDVPVKASEARDVLRIIEKAIESAQMGRDIAL